MSLIYSVLCHEHPDSVVDMIQNIFYYHKDISCTIVLNTTPDMYTVLKAHESPTIFLAPPSNKQMWTYDILKGHIINFTFCQTNALRSTYFIPLASNCMFHRHVTLSEINDACASVATSSSPAENYAKWHWPKFFRNYDIIRCLRKHNIHKFYRGNHEGAILPYDIMAKIVNFTLTNNIISLIQQETVFEEMLLHTLYSHFVGREIVNICKIFTTSPNLTPSIEEIEAEKKPCVKRVDRNYNDPVRSWLRTQANNYV